MAIVHLEFDLDSNVYPELHAALSVLRSPQAQTERVRQLATLGLVWENVRIYGAAAIGPTHTGNSLGATPPPSMSAPRAKRGGKAKRPDMDSSLTGEPAARAGPPAGDFVNLAIDADGEAIAASSAPSTPSHLMPLTLSQSEVDQVARELPVLVDIVNDSLGDSDADQETDTDRAEKVRAQARGRQAATRSMPPPSRMASQEKEAPPEAVVSVLDDAVHLTSLAEKPAMRSRLLRMKERGLFKNG